MSSLPHGTILGSLQVFIHFSLYQRAKGVFFLDPVYVPPAALYSLTNLPESYARHLLPTTDFLILSLISCYNFGFVTFDGTDEPKLTDLTLENCCCSFSTIVKPSFVLNLSMLTGNLPVLL